MKFLTPTLPKIIASLLITIISETAIYAYVARHTLVCTSYGCPTVGEVAMKTTLNSIIPTLLFSYLISCTAIYTFDKLKNEKIIKNMRKEKKK